MTRIAVEVTINALMSTIIAIRDDSMCCRSGGSVGPKGNHKIQVRLKRPQLLEKFSSIALIGLQLDNYCTALSQWLFILISMATDQEIALDNCRQCL